MPLQRTLLAFAIGLAVLPAHAADPQDPTMQALLDRIAALEQRLAAVEGRGPATGIADVEAVDQRLRVVERRQELQVEADASRAASVPVLALADKGLSVKSANGEFEVRLRGLVQGDFRYYGGDASVSQLDSFLLRLAFQGFQLGEGRYRPFPDDALAGPLWVTVMPGAAIANIFSAGSAIVLLTTAAAVPSTAIS